MSERTESLPLSTLMESPTNPRRQFDDAYLAELAESIKHQGLLQPITVRPIHQTDLEYQYEIVFGHCRSRAARLAGLEFIPCFIRELDDEQAAEQQLHENLHRKDISAIEEADGLRALMRDHRVHVNELVKRTGKSRAYIYGQVKLADAAPAVRAAVLQDGLSAEVARSVARLPSHRLQEQVLRGLRHGDSWASTRWAKQAIERAVADTTEATWDLDDATLHGGACRTCPNLAANDADLAELSAGACIDPDCFAAKRANAAEALITFYRNAGRDVVAGDEARVIAPYPSWLVAGHSRRCISLRAPALSSIDPSTGDRATRTLGQLHRELPEHMREHLVPRLVVIPEHEEDPHEVLTAEQAGEALRWWLATMDEDDDAKLEHWAQRATQPTPSPAARGDEEAAGEAVEEDPGDVAMRDAKVRSRVRDLVAARIASSPRTTDDLRLLLADQLHNAPLSNDDVDRYAPLLGLGEEWSATLDEGTDGLEWLLGRAPTMTADQLGALLMLIVVENNYIPGMSNTAMARAYGIDPAVVANEESQSVDAGSAGEEQTVDTGSAGEVQTDEAGPAGPVVRDLFAEEQAS